MGWPPTPQGYLHLYFKKLRSHPQPTENPTLGILPMGAFLSFPSRGGLPSSRKTVQTTFCTVICIFSTKSSKARVFWSVFACFCNVFPQNTVIYTFVAIKPFQNIIFLQCSNSLISPNPWKHRYLHCFLQFFHVPMLLANSNIYNHIYKKSFKHIVFTHVFRHKVGLKHWFLRCFQGSGIKKTFNSLISLNPWKHVHLHYFLQFFHVPMPLANSNIYTKNPSKTLFFQCFYIFSVKNTVIKRFSA